MKLTWKIWAGVLVLFFVSLFLFKPSPNDAASPNQQTGFFASDPVVPKLSRPVSELATESIIPDLDREINPRHNPHMFEPDMGKRGTWDRQNVPLDPLIGKSMNSGRTPDVILNFEGLGNDAGVSPPDVVGDVGPNHYVQMVNIQFGIYDKSGNLLAGPTPFNALFNGAGGNCESQNAGDPVPVYDSMADRWLLSQFASPNHMCIAISTTPDPTGSYYLYEFNVGDFPDYFKFGAWPDGYYMSGNESGANDYTAYAFDRINMLAGQAATFQKFVGQNNFLLPSDVDGDNLPPTGAPNYFYTFKDDTYHGGGNDRVEVFAFDVDWNTPGNSSFTLVDTINVASFTYTACGFFNFNCIRQPGTSQRFDSLGEWPMFSFRYRNFNSHETLVGTYGIGGGTGSVGAAVRWFELRKTGADWILHQEGTHDPNDGHDRFNSSIAMDGAGNIALGFSVSSPSLYPSIHYTTRLASDPLGTMQTEAIMLTGSGSQTGSSRWGDYSALSLDPTDDCTFWYTNEYYLTNSGNGWHTRIGSFKLPECGTADFTLNVDPDNLKICTPNPAIYTVDVGQVLSYTTSVSLTAVGHPAGTTATFSTNPITNPASTTLTIGNTGSASAGNYSLMVIGTGATSTHTSTVTLDVFTGVPGAPTLNLPADGAMNVGFNPTFTWFTATQVSEYFLEVASDPGFSTIVYSATVSGNSHQAETILNAATTYYWRVTAANICGAGASSSTFNFTIQSSSLVCNGAMVDFESGIPADWSVVDNSIGGDGIVWGTTADTECGIGNLTNGTGEAACADSDASGSGAPPYDTELISPPIDLSNVTTATLDIAAYYRDLTANSNDIFDVDVWNGASWDTLVHWDENHQPEDIMLDLANYTGQSNAQVRFRYAGNGYDWYAQVDDINLSCSLPTADITLTKTVGTDPGACATTDQIDVSVDTEVTYCYEVENTGTFTLTLHDLEDDMLGTILNSQAYTLTPGSTFWLTATTIITQDTLNTATWTAYNPGPIDEAMDSDTAMVNVIEPEIVLTKTVGTDPASCAPDDMLSLLPGSQVTYCYQVENTGAVTLTWHLLTDDQLGEILPPTSYILPPGATYWVTETTVVTQDTINVAWWYAATSGPDRADKLLQTIQEVTATDTAMVTMLIPEISLSKTVGTDPTSCANQSDLIVGLGTEVVYCYQVTNTGAYTLTSHDLGDDQLGPLLSGYAYDLGPGASVWVTETTVITADTVNMATWTAYTTEPVNVVTATAWATVTLGTPAITLTKTVGTDPASCGVDNELSVVSGSQVTYCYTVENLGDITLHLHDLEDDVLGTLLSSQWYTLTPGNTYWLTASLVITADTVNMATWTAYNSGELDLVRATAWATVTLASPEISLNKTVGTDPVSCASNNTLSVVSGSEVTYCYSVTNSGDIPFTSHDLWDDQLGTILSDTAYTLNPGESYWLTQTVTISEDTVNMAIWTASEITYTTAVSATAWATVTLASPEISLNKTVGTDPASCASSNTISVVSGSEVTYCYSVTNSGDIPFTSHDLWDDQLGTILSDTAYTLNPGESYWLTQTVTISEDTVNMAIWTAAEMTYTTAVSATAWATVTTVTDPTYGLILATDTTALSGLPSETVTYTLWLTNTGDVIDSYTLSSSGAWANNTSADVTDLPAGSSAMVALWVTIPATATNNQMDETTVTATSVGDESATANLSVTTTAIVEETNQAPEAVDDTATTEAETALVITVLDNDSDLDGDTITVTIVSDPTNGSATITDTGILYSPEANFSGTDTFSYTITDGALTDSALVTVTVNEVVSVTYGVQVVAPVSALSGTAGSSVTYTVWVTNTGSSTDTFEVSGTGLGTASLPATVGPLAAGVGQSLNVVVAIPATASNGQQYLTEVVATSQGDNTQSDSVTLTTTAIVEEESGFILYLPLVLK